MEKKMTIEDVDKIIQLQNRLTKLYEEQDALFDEIFKKYGDSIHYLEHNDREYPWIKVAITDNVQKLKDGLEVWKAAKFSKFVIETRPLKRKPKETEE